MVKWPRFGSCKTRLSKDIGKKNALKIQNKMLSHTLSVSKNVKERKIAEVRMAITGMGFNSSRRWCKDLGINNFCFQGKGCLGEKMKRQIYKSQRILRTYQKKNIIFIQPTKSLHLQQLIQEPSLNPSIQRVVLDFYQV